MKTSKQVRSGIVCVPDCVCVCVSGLVLMVDITVLKVVMNSD